MKAFFWRVIRQLANGFAVLLGLIGLVLLAWSLWVTNVVSELVAVLFILAAIFLLVVRLLLKRRDVLVRYTEQPTLPTVEGGETEIAVPEANDKGPHSYSVQGQITQPGGRPLAGVTVRAFDRDLRREQLLGQTQTDERGRYTIGYTAAQFIHAEKSAADLVVRVYSPRGAVLGESPVRFTAAQVEQIPLAVRMPQEAPPSEYEHLLAALAPVLGDLQPADLTQEDIAFLLGEFAGDRVVQEARLHILADSARLERQTRLPAEFFYGVARVRPFASPLSLETFLGLSPEAVRAAVLQAVEANIVPARIGDALDTILARLEPLAVEHGVLVRRPVAGRLLHRDTGAALVSYRVRAFDLDAGAEPKDLGFDRSDVQGQFMLFYTASAAENTSQRRLRLRVATPDGKDLQQTDLAVAPDQTETLLISVAVPAVPDPAAIPLAQVAALAGGRLPAGLLNALTQRDIHTLADVRQVGGVQRLEGVSADDPGVRTVNAHANLAVLSPDVARNQTLIDRGFPSILSIANTTRASFVSAVQDKLGTDAAAELHAKADAQAKFLGQVLLGLQAEHANGFPSSLPGVTNPAVPELFESKCACEDCEAAVSPLAYLADLLDYAVMHLRDAGKQIDLDWLAATFHQPFSDLPVTCEAADKQVRQVRMCIEVLRSYLPDTAEDHAYLLAAYTALLSKLGTSYEEIRLAKSADADARKALADRLGVDLSPDHPDELDSLFLTPAELVEFELERRFGLPASTHDVLSQGLKSGDSYGQILHWNVDHPEWNRSTDATGKVYLSLKKLSGSEYRLDVYRDPARQAHDLVASGTRETSTGPLVVLEANASGLSGHFSLKYTVDSTTIDITVIPEVLGWRLKHLRTLWKEQDHPTDAYNTKTAKDRLPIVDPDLIGPDDFRLPVDTDASFGLWKKRRAWVDGQLKDLAGLTKPLTGADGTVVMVPDLQQMLQRMYQTVAYSGTNTVSVVPWAGAPLPALFDLLYEQLTLGPTPEDVAAAQKTITTALRLTTESFTRLIELKRKDTLATSGLGHEPVSEGDWQEVYSILVSAQKRAFREAWLTEENEAAVTLDPKVFWISLREPMEGDWPAHPSKEQLATTNPQPLIDPALLALKDLPEPPAGADAIQRWKARQKQLDQIRQALKAKQDDGFIALIQVALGDQPPGAPGVTWDTYLQTVLTKLNDPGLDPAAKTQLLAPLYLSEGTFRRLMEIGAKPEPTADEWAEALAILTDARKAKVLYPTWHSDEGIFWTTPEHALLYWRVWKAKLPRWRASAEERQAWQQALRTRSGPPIVDPDVIGKEFLRDPLSGAALAVWNARRDWVDTQLTNLKHTREQAATAVDGFGTIVQQTVSIAADQLDELVAQRKAGEDIRALLEQLSLTTEAFNSLARVRTLLTQVPPPPVLDVEWDSVYEILAQVSKRRQFGVWREQEVGLLLGPDDFQFPDPPPVQFPPPEPTPLGPWLAARRDRREWEDTLEARIEQVKATSAAVYTAVSETEEATLPLLRDALVDQVQAGGTTFNQRAQWVTDALLIDARADGCQLTTRVAQAIETIQGIVWSIRTGQLQDTYPALTLDADDFEEEWKWIGSYATWRSAMFVVLYPENILIPSLRRWQTPAFTRLIEQTRSGRRLTPEAACAAAGAYAGYFQDVCTLTIEATCQTQTQLHRGTCRDRADAGSSYLFYMFGRGQANPQTVYWSAYDPDAPDKDYAQSFWDVVPGMDNVATIAGAVPYTMAESQRQIYLFAYTTKHKLVFSRYDLETQAWESEPSGELDLPSDAEICQIVAVQRNSEDQPPALGINCLVGGYFLLYVRPLNREADDWAGTEDKADQSQGSQASEDDWRPYLADNHQKELYAIVESSTTRYVFSRMAQSDSVIIHPRDLANPNSLLLVIQLGVISWIGALMPVDDTVYAFFKEGDRPMAQEITRDAGSPPTLGLKYLLLDTEGVVPIAGAVPIEKQQYAYNTTGTNHGAYRTARFLYLLGESGEASRITPVDPSRYAITEYNSADPKQELRRWLMLFIWSLKATMLESTRAYLQEAWYFVPIHLALELHRAGQYEAALNWFRTAYDYGAPKAARRVSCGIMDGASLEADYERAQNWLLDPLNPHAIAATRKDTYTRFTLLAIVRCLLDYAEAEYTLDTAESVPRARTLFQTALELLDADEVRQALNVCHDLVVQFTREGEAASHPPAAAGDNVAIYRAPVEPELYGLIQELRRISAEKQLRATLPVLKQILARDQPWDVRLAAAYAVVRDARSKQAAPMSLKRQSLEKKQVLERAHAAALAHTTVSGATSAVGTLAASQLRQSTARLRGYESIALEYGTGARRRLEATGGNPRPSRADGAGAGRDPRGGGGTELTASPSTVAWSSVTAEGYGQDQGAAEPPPQATSVVTASYPFCVPANPVIEALWLRAQVNLYKIRTCRNIAGIERQLDPYAAPTDTVSGLPQIGAGGQLVLPGAVTLQPTPYRYQVLIDRAKRLVELAAQLESAMLSALEKYDAEAFQLLKARQDVRLANAGVRLHDLRVREAESGVDLAELRQARAELQKEHFEQLLAEPISGLEAQSLQYMATAAALQATAATASFVAAALPSGTSNTGVEYSPQGSAGAIASGLSSLAAAASTAAGIFGALANYERRAQEWDYQKQLAEQDIVIGKQEVKLAQDHVRVVGQERKIAEMQADHAKDVMEFLANKFTSAELYHWMSGVLEGVYGYFLQQATALAQLAAQQLAFERQAAPPPYIQADYWEAPTGGVVTTSSTESAGADRRGLTGSARLLRDIYQLDQYAFDTDTRKLQLTKTISLARLGPVEFQRFRETGVLRFDTPMALFDWDFPGHYLRLIKRVRTSVIALIPAADGIRATLTTAGPSRVVIGDGGLYQKVPVRRPLESVALASPINASGLFDLTPQPGEMLLPFEGLGVDTSWELRLPKASNRFDYSTIADVLLTLDYTALDDSAYRQQVIQQLDTQFSAARPFSFRYEFADPWYDLHNPELTATPMVVGFQTRRQDFPPNLEDLKIQHVTLHFARNDGATFEVPVTHLRFTEQGGAGTVGGGATSIDGLISTRNGNAGSWTPMLGKSPLGKWELALPKTEEMKNRFKEEEIEDILLVVTYRGQTPPWPA
jgi:hypothetical protein